MQTTFSNRYVRFFETVVRGELALAVFVGVVFLLMGSRSVHDIGVGFLVTSFGVSLLGVASVVQNVRNSALPEGTFVLPPGVRGVDPAAIAAVNLSPATYRLFWVTVAMSAAAFCVGAVMVQFG